ncbi:MAG TPA: glycosyltransferase family 4 protein, partial [Blastocatellia bacterium]|nr:glycosyltransferase family 4 protein [Blastocatellia bacterium]
MVVTGSDSNGCEPDFNQTLAREKTDCVPGRGIKILALMEADSVTGPAKNLIDFAERSLQADQSGACPIQVSIATFTRGTAFRESDHEGPGGRRTAAAPSPFVTAARHAGIEVNLVRERFRFDIGALSEIKKIVERSSSSVIQTHNVKSHFLVRVSGLWRSVPWVAFHHGYTATDAKMSVYNKLDRWSLKAAARVVTVSRAYARMLESSGVSESRIRVVHNSVDPARYRGAPKTGVHRLRWELGLGPAGRMVLAVGRLSREKAHVDLVDAFCRLVRRRPGIDLRLVIAGEGPERRSIEEAIVARG